MIWCDEAQQFVNDMDSHYLAQCRSHRGCMVFLTQSVHSYYSRFKGEAGRSQADALLSNFRHKVIHSLGDPQTADWASSQDGGDPFDAMFGRSHYTGNFSEHFEQILQPNLFLSGLRTGGSANGFVADAIVIRSGEPFSNGQNYLLCSFSQKG